MSNAYISFFESGEYEKALEDISKLSGVDLVQGLVYKSMIHLTEWQIEDAASTISEAEALYSAFPVEPIPHMRLAIEFVRATLSNRYQNQDEAIQMFTQSLNASESSDNPEVHKWRSYIYQGLGNSFRHNNQYQESMKAYENALEIARKLGNSSMIADALNSIGVTHDLQNQLNQAKKYYVQALDIWQFLNHQHRLFYVNNNLGIVNLKSGDLQKARDYFLSNLNYLQTSELQNPHLYRVTYANLGWVYQQENNFDEALLYYETSINYAKISKSILSISFGLFKLIYLLTELNRTNEAKAYQNELEELSRTEENSLIEIDYLLSSVLILRDSKSLEGYVKAMKILDDLSRREIDNFETKMQISLLRCEFLILEYKVTSSSDVLQQVSDVISSIVSLAETHNSQQFLIEALILKSKVHFVTDSVDTAYHFINQAVEVAEQLQIDYYINKVTYERHQLVKAFKKIAHQSLKHLNVTSKMNDILILEYIEYVARKLK